MYFDLCTNFIVLEYVQAGLAMNGIFEVLGKNKKYIEFYNTARARRPSARADHAT